MVVGAIVSFTMAWGIGANDVANSFGTSVGAKTITLTQACCIAAVFEFAGAIGLGGEVTKTIAGSIARPAAFRDDPELFAYGMLIALVSASAWVYFATYLSLAVSTTHSIIGAIIGFALVWRGKDAIVWNDHLDKFPYSQGLVPVVCSWFVSPIASGIVAAVLFILNRFFILRHKNSTTLAIWCFPVLVVITVFINVFFVLFKGAKNELHWTQDKAAWVAGAVAGGCLILAVFLGVPILKWQLARDAAAQEQAAIDAEAPKVDVEVPEPTTMMGKAWARFSHLATRGLKVDIHANIEDNAHIAAMHQAAEVFDPKTEQVFKYLQVFSACAVSFAHGANDVANAVGPFAAIWYVYRNFAVSSSAETPKWILALGGAGIVIGLATYGYNIMRTLGVGMAKMTPSRGYCAEIATSFTVALSSVYGLPVSTTQCIVGAEVGVGVCENARTGTNWLLFGKTALAWVFTLIVSAIIAAALFAAGAYAPSITMARDIAKYETALRAVTTDLYAVLNATNTANAAAFGNFSYDRYLVKSLNTAVVSTNALFDTAKKGYIPPADLIANLNQSVNSFKNYSVVAVGFQPKLAQFNPSTTSSGSYPTTAINVPSWGQDISTQG